MPPSMGSNMPALANRDSTLPYETVQKPLAKPCYMWKTFAGLAIFLGSCFRRNDECWFFCTVSYAQEAGVKANL